MPTGVLAGERALRTSAWLVAAGAILSGPVAMVIVSAIAPQPRWTTAAAFIDNYHAIQVLPYLLGYVLLAGFVLFAASCHAIASGSLKVRTSAAWVFSTAGMVSFAAWNTLIPVCFGLIAIRAHALPSRVR